MIPPRLRWALRRVLLRHRAGARFWWRTHARDHELDFWASWLELQGAGWREDYARRLTPSPLIEDPLVTARLDEIERADVRIIDVGAGPITILGTHYPGKSIEVVPVDPLADQYDRLLNRFGVEPPVRTIKADGEHLLRHFAPATFDIAYATNSIDHSYDPLRIIENMLALVRADGVVLLRHARNEGEREHYSGPHQWNFDVEDEDVVIWNHAERHSLRRAFAGRAEVQGWIEGVEVLVRLTPLPEGEHGPVQA